MRIRRELAGHTTTVLGTPAVTLASRAGVATNLIRVTLDQVRLGSPDVPPRSWELPQ